MALKPAGTSSQNIRWSSAPTFQTRATGVPEVVELSKWIVNPSNLTVFYQLAAGYTYPSGWSQANNSGGINVTNAAVVTKKNLKWVATAQGKASRTSELGWVETIAAIVEVPTQPTNVVAQAVSPTSITVTWAPGSGGSTITAFKVFRSLTGAAPWDYQIPGDVVPPAANTKTDTTLQAAQKAWYMVVAYDANGATAQSVAVSDTTPFAKPAAPINLTAASSGSTSIHVEWTVGSSGTPTVSYRLEASETGVEGTFAVTQDSDVLLTTQYNHTGLDPLSTRHYRVRARDAQGMLSDASNTASATTDAVTILPATPINLTARVLSSSAIQLTWQAGSGGPAVTEYRIHRSLVAGGPYDQVAVVTAADELASDTFNRANANDLGASWDGGVNPTYTMSMGISANTAKKTLQPEAIAWELNNSVTWPADQYSQIMLAATGATLGAGVGPAVRIGGTSLSGAVGYWLIVSGGGYALRKFSGAPNVIVAQGATPTFAANDVVRLSVSGSNPAVLRGDKGGVEFFSYTDSTPISTGKAGIAYYLNDATAAVQNWSGGSNALYDDTGLAESTRYYYQVSAYDGTSESEKSVEKNATTFTVSPTVPTILSVVPLASAPQDTLRVTWQAGSGGSPPTKYHLTHATTPAGTFSPVGGDITDTFYNHGSLAAGSTHYYKLTALDAQNDESTQTAAAYGTTAAALTPSIPVNVTAAAASTSSISVSWTPGSEGSQITQFKIHRSLTSGSGFEQVGTSGASPYLDTNSGAGLAPATRYYYRVSATDGVTDSAESAQTSAVTDSLALVATPVNVQAAAQSASVIQVTWQAGSGGPTPTGWQVFRASTQAGGYIPQGGVLPATPLSYNNGGLNPSTPYWYKVAAVASGVQGALSEPGVSATTWGTSGASLSWTVPTRNIDGTAITDLTGYRLSAGMVYGVETNYQEITSPTQTSYVWSHADFSAGEVWYFWIRARNSSNTLSASSPVVVRMF